MRNTKKWFNARLIFIMVFMGLLSSGCATVGGLKPGKGSTFEVEKRTYDQIWKAAITVVSRSLTVVETNKPDGVIKAEKRAGMTTSGEVAGVFIQPSRANKNKFLVEVVSQKRSRLQITGQNWEKTIVEGIKAELDL